MITLGTDAELILTEFGVPVSAIDKIGGSKDHPFIVPKGNLQEDNVLAEFAIDPVSSEGEWVDSIKSVMESLKAKVGELDLKIKASELFPPFELTDVRASIFGCDPDFNAWSLMPNPAPDVNEVKNLRTCGGHIHVGYEVGEDDVESRANLIKWMDIYLGLPSVLIDDDRMRRSVYGKAGAFRIKSYGVEYRSLSNFWLQTEDLMRWAYQQTHKAYQKAMSSKAPEEYADEIQSAINDSDRRKATVLISKLDVCAGAEKWLTK